MVRIAYLLLCHGPPERPAAVARLLAAGGDAVAVHYDANASATDTGRLRAALAELPDVVLTQHRFRCGWGEWSLVAATMELARVAIDRFPDATHFYLVSGDCMPIRPRAAIVHALAAGDRDFIEAADFFTSGWIRTGLAEERLTYRHYVNERRHPALFYAMLATQKRLGLSRSLPSGVRVMIGAQWWCLRRQTLLNILAHCALEPKLEQFFRTSWIPDETWFQTLTAHLVPRDQIAGASPTFHVFTDYGMPTVFHDDHADLLSGQPHFFARKIAPEATGLRSELARTYLTGKVAGSQATDGEGASVHAFVTGQGRVGFRFGPRAWERGASIGRGQSLYLICCKKWQIGQRLQQRIATRIGVPGLGYIFDDPSAGLPDLGGLERGMDKRHTHARAFVRLLFEAVGGAALILCLDPGRDGLVRDFMTDACDTRLLDIRCAFTNAEILSHARRIDLAGPDTPTAAFDSLVPVLRAQIAAEAAVLAEAGGNRAWRISDNADNAANAQAVAGFLGIGEDSARGILDTPGLFD